MWQENSPYGSGAQNAYYSQPQGTSQSVPLQFYSPNPGQDPSGFYSTARPSLEGSVSAQGSMAPQASGSYGGSIQPQGGWWTAFGTGGFEGEPPLLEGTHM